MSEATDGDVIINALKSEANTLLVNVIGSTPLEGFNITGTDRGNFPYVWENPRDLKFNKKTYTWIDGNLKANTNPLQFNSDAGFTKQYLEQVENIRWSLSKEEQATLNEAVNNATDQQAAVLNAWESAFGSLPSGTSPIDKIAKTIINEWAVPSTTLNEIKTSLNLRRLLNKTPSAGQQVLPAFVVWLIALGSSLTLQNNVTINNTSLDRAIDAIQNPNVSNGGLEVDDGEFHPAYKVANQVSEIENVLNTGNSVSLDMVVYRSTADDFEVSISGQTEFSIPILKFLNISVGTNTGYFSSDIATTNNTTNVSMSFPGTNLINYGPVAFTQTGASESWYWMDPIRAAIENGFPAADVSGYKFATEPTISDWGANGQFGYVSGVAIAAYPTVIITVKSANYKRIQETFEQTVNSSVSFLGIKLASASGATYSNEVQADESKSTVTITLNPPQALVGGNDVDSVAWVLGVQAMYPAI